MKTPSKPAPTATTEELKRSPHKGASKTARIPVKVVARTDKLQNLPGCGCARRLVPKAAHRHIATKSGLMVGLGETREEIVDVMRDLRAHGCELLTIGQYLQPSGAHLSVERYIHPDESDELARIGEALGFRHVASGPLVRSSYHAERQAHGL